MTAAPGSVVSIARDVSSRRRSAVEVTREALSRIEETDASVQAFLEVTAEQALEEARRTDARVAAGENLALAGVPMAIKDNMWIAGRTATCGSKILQGYRPPGDATAIARLRREGAVFIGRTNMDEFAMGSSTENSSVRPTRNPWDRERIPGGSSGGSAAAVSSRMVPGALGSDTGGSIRQPAACCGIVGLKPTYGRVSRYGLVAFASSLDQIGPLTLDVADSARLYHVLAGRDALDSTTSAEAPGDPEAALERGVAGLKVGFLAEAQVEGLDAEVASNLGEARRAFEEAGARVSNVSVARAPAAIAIYYVVASAEASSNLARFDGVRYGPRRDDSSLLSLYVENRTAGFGPEVKRRILLGTFALSAGYYDAYYGRAMRARQLLLEDFERAFEEVDVIVCPTIPAPAFRLGEKVDDPLTMYLSDVFTVPASLAGLPAISVPSGLSRGGLPLGIQIMARRFAEETLFAAARAFERQVNFPDTLPPGVRAG
ncbi:MAG TPA: Asp-tRNA(Asn)/Glu-tRNA(Gln) amidotransferase subunit GatA [Thermoanaerobaculia bacterium]|nr:Asp-tRNA(Asn)/Glu-tRNA(Gln) amidotransferase subunit GatA [Thermoanaerobaculia bacterium]